MIEDDLVLLAVDGDLCSGPAHLPAPSRWIAHNPGVFQRQGSGSGNRSGRTQTLVDKTKGAAGFLPLLWPSMCGDVKAGHIYVRTDLTTQGGECFSCRMAQLTLEKQAVREPFGRATRERLTRLALEGDAA